MAYWSDNVYLALFHFVPTTITNDNWPFCVSKCLENVAASTIVFLNAMYASFHFGWPLMEVVQAHKCLSWSLLDVIFVVIDKRSLHYDELSLESLIIPLWLSDYLPISCSLFKLGANFPSVTSKIHVQFHVIYFDLSALHNPW